MDVCHINWCMHELLDSAGYGPAPLSHFCAPKCAMIPASPFPLRPRSGLPLTQKHKRCALGQRRGINPTLPAFPRVIATLPSSIYAQPTTPTPALITHHAPANPAPLHISAIAGPNRIHGAIARPAQRNQQMEWFILADPRCVGWPSCCAGRQLVSQIIHRGLELGIYINLGLP